MHFQRKGTAERPHSLIKYSALAIFLFSATGNLQSCKKKEPTPVPEPVVVTPIYMEPITDIDGNVYQTVKIGNQIWTASNLKTTHYRNGDPIPNLQDETDWNDQLPTGAYCSYGNNANTAETYGLLYNWYALDDSRGLAPDGWRIPTPEEFYQLMAYLGEEGGGNLKATGTVYWHSPNTGATNTTGFAALAGGHRTYYGSFEYMGERGNFWTDLGVSSIYAERVALYYNQTTMGFHDNYRKACGFSIRLIKE